MSREIKASATPLANRLRAFVAERRLDARIDSNVLSLFADLAIRAEAVDNAGSEAEVAREALTNGLGWLELAYAGGDAQERDDIQLGSDYAVISGAVEMLPGVMEAHRLGCRLELDPDDCSLWMCRRGFADVDHKARWEHVRPQKGEDFLGAIRLVACVLAGTEKTATSAPGVQ
jgi:hypothetical protein